MFIVYVADLEVVAAKHSVNTVHRLENCITDVGQWMSANQLKFEHREDRATLGWIKTRSVLCD